MTAPPPAPLPSAQATALANAAKTTLSIVVPAKSAQSAQRKPASTGRQISYISPSTASVGLSAMYGATSVYQTSFTLGSPYCSPVALSNNRRASAISATEYQCTISLPVGTYTIYTNLYDGSNNLLSTNVYANPYPSTIYANGSPYGNYVHVSTQGVIGFISQASPTLCFATGFSQQIPVLIMDADGNQIVGPLANPITPTFTAYDGAGLGAFGIYATYAGYPVSVNNVTVYDTSVYSSPYLFVSGAEGAINAAASVANLPVYSHGVYTLSPYAGVAATGAYTGWGLGPYGLTPIAIQPTTHQAVPCQSINGPTFNWGFVGGIQDPTSGAPYLVTGDSTNTIRTFDAMVVANPARAYSFASPYGSQSWLNQIGTYTASGYLVNFFTSANVTGRIDVLSEPGPYGAIDLIDTANGSLSDIGTYHFSTQIPLATGATRLFGAPLASALYYSDPGTAFIYGVNTQYGSPLSTITMYGTPLYGGQIYAASVSGGAYTYDFVRGKSPGGAFYICAFDAANFSLGFYCHGTSSTVYNTHSMSYDPGSGYLMWAGGGTAAYALNPHQSPSNFVSSLFPAGVYTLAQSACAIRTNEGAPGIVGFFGFPGCGTATAAQITWLQYSGGSWTYLASLYWPNDLITITYP